MSESKKDNNQESVLKLIDEEGFGGTNEDIHNVLSSEEIKEGRQLETYVEDIADTVRIGLDQSISILTPWFFSNMPQIYYQTTPRQEKVRHLSAIITGHVFETKQTVELWDRDRSKVTYIGPGGDRNILDEMASRLAEFPFKMGSLYFSRDKLLYLSTFFSNRYTPLDLNNSRIKEKVDAARDLLLKEFPKDPGSVEYYLKNLDNDFVTYATTRRLQVTYHMVRHMMSHEGAHTILENFADPMALRVTIGMKNIAPASILATIFHLMHRYDYNLRRAFIVHFEHGRDEMISVMHFILDHNDPEMLSRESVPMRRLNKAFRTLGWVDVDEYDLFGREPFNLSINACNLIRAVACWVHLAKGKENPNIFSTYKIRTVFMRYVEETLELVKIFRAKFDPMRSDERVGDHCQGMVETMKQRIEKIVEEVDRSVFVEALNFIESILKTNYFLNTKTGLAFRLTPELIGHNHYDQKPYGIFFIVGRDFRFFQVRWKDISRGGLRVVMPRSPTDYDYALLGLFDEVYGLSLAQQLKNKDIPEGGAKAVLLLRPGGHRDQAVKGAVNALLDLLVKEDESQEGSTDDLLNYYGREEIIYLGPDENITNDLINWITEQAERRGYTYHAAFMSSKPGAGINHKEFGVTSEGLNVFVHNMLMHCGINPEKDSFSVKMTGGPDGDVAGNELKILHREYGERARVVAIADGYGAAYDPNGLNWSELLRLVKEGLAIDHFDPKKISDSKEAFVVKTDCNENILIRNRLASEKYADIFIPAGGRPYTVNDNNWNAFFDAQGKASMRAIVEGANIFFTPGARKELQKRGVLILKDSSANKTGVICSSFEIIASLILNNDEFKAIKQKYVSEVIDILRSKADLEAKLLFRELGKSDGHATLVELSLQISKEINEVTDAMLDGFTEAQATLATDELFKRIVLRHCPPIIVDLYKDRIPQKLPIAHQIAIVSAYIASFIVYREGLGWLSHIPQSQRFKAARMYMDKTELATELVSSVEKSHLERKSEIVEILKRSAARDLTYIGMEGMEDWR